MGPACAVGRQAVAFPVCPGSTGSAALSCGERMSAASSPGSSPSSATGPGLGKHGAPDLPDTPGAAWSPSHSTQEARAGGDAYAEVLWEREASNQVDSAYLERAARSCPHLTATVRAAVVDFMVDAAWRLRLTCDTVSLAVGLLDRYLAAVSRGDARAPGGKGLRLCAAVCVWVAAKFEHGSAPPLDLFTKGLLHGQFGNSEALEMERELLQAVDYRLASVTTVSAFLLRTMHAHCMDEAAAGRHVSVQLPLLAAYLAELSLLEYQMLAFRPSLIAAAAFSLAHALLGTPQPRAADFARLTGYAPAAVAGVRVALQQVHTIVSQAAANKCMYATTLKFAIPQRACVSAIAPLLSVPLFTAPPVAATTPPHAAPAPAPPLVKPAGAHRRLPRAPLAALGDARALPARIVAAAAAAPHVASACAQELRASVMLASREAALISF